MAPQGTELEGSPSAGGRVIVGRSGITDEFMGKATDDRDSAPQRGWWAVREHTEPSPRLKHIAPYLWPAWTSGVIAGSLLLMNQNVWVYAGFVTAASLLPAVIPDSGDSPAPYYFHLAIPLFVMRGLKEGGLWTFAGWYWAFFLTPIADVIVGVDTYNKREDEYRSLRPRIGFRLATWIFVPVQVAFLAWACHVVNTMHMSTLELTGFIISVGIYTGGIGITISHELVHKPTRFEQWLGRAVCVVISYGHFYVEHNRGHHKLVATDQDPATARLGESFWAFLPRCVVGSFMSAWRLEEDKRRDRNLPYWHNEMLWYWTASACLCGALTAAFGLKSIMLFLAQSLVGIILFESVNYLEHYGLERQQDKEGKTEPVGFEHSWDAPHRLTNIVLFRLQRHGDHHVNSTRRYQMLRAEPVRSPQLPLGYPGCILMALCPPIWRAVMDQRVLRLRRAHKGPRRWRHGPSA